MWRNTPPQPNTRFSIKVYAPDLGSGSQVDGGWLGAALRRAALPDLRTVGLWDVWSPAGPWSWVLSMERFYRSEPHTHSQMG